MDPKSRTLEPELGSLLASLRTNTGSPMQMAHNRNIWRYIHEVRETGL